MKSVLSIFLAVIIGLYGSGLTIYKHICNVSGHTLTSLTPNLYIDPCHTPKLKAHDCDQINHKNTHFQPKETCCALKSHVLQDSSIAKVKETDCCAALEQNARCCSDESTTFQLPDQILPDPNIELKKPVSGFFAILTDISQYQRFEAGNALIFYPPLQPNPPPNPPYGRTIRVLIQSFQV